MERTNKARECTRRHFVIVVAAGVGGAALSPGCRGKATSRWQFLTEEEARLVEAISEQIIPADQDAGARDAGVVGFIDRQLAGFYAKHQQDYRHGLAAVEDSSRAMFGKRFEALDWDRQTEVLQALDSGEAPGDSWKRLSSRDFFRLIRNHTMQGFYGSPRHGGNRDYVSYKMIGLDFPPYIGQNRYRE